MLAIYKRELQSYFFTASAYVFMGVFLALGSVFYAVGNLAAQSSDLLGLLWNMGYLWMLLTPILTMHTYAGERKSRTDQLLFTSPVSLTGIVAGKFLAGVTVLLGAVAAVKRGGFMDSFSMFIAMIGVSVPSFILGALFQYFLALQLRKTFHINLFPIQGWGSFNQTILPAFALGLGSLATVSRLMRTSMLDVLSQDYIKTAKSKGLSQRQIIWRHALRNAIMPVVTIMGPTVASVLTGTFVIESIFNIPGLGKYFVISIKDLDYTMISGTVVFYGGLLILCTLIVDLLYGFIDPRVKLEG